MVSMTTQSSLGPASQPEKSSFNLILGIFSCGMSGQGNDAPALRGLCRPALQLRPRSARSRGEEARTHTEQPVRVLSVLSSGLFTAG